MTAACQKLVQSILELPATDEIHMEDRKKIRTKPGTYPTNGIYSTQNSEQGWAKTATFECRTNKMKNNQNIERDKLDQIDARNI